MATQTTETLLTDEVKALIGRESEVVEGYEVADEETVRRYAICIPDQDPRYWGRETGQAPVWSNDDASLACLVFRGSGAALGAGHDDETMNNDWFHDSGRGQARSGAEPREGALPNLRSVQPKLRSHLHAGDEIEFYQYAKIGDKVHSQRRIADIQEKVGRRGAFLLITTESRYWNQDNELLLIVRTLGAESP